MDQHSNYYEPKIFRAYGLKCLTSLSSNPNMNSEEIIQSIFSLNNYMRSKQIKVIDNQGNLIQSIGLSAYRIFGVDAAINLGKFGLINLLSSIRSQLEKKCKAALKGFLLEINNSKKLTERDEIIIEIILTSAINNETLYSFFIDSDRNIIRDLIKRTFLVLDNKDKMLAENNSDSTKSIDYSIVRQEALTPITTEPDYLLEVEDISPPSSPLLQFGVQSTNLSIVRQEPLTPITTPLDYLEVEDISPPSSPLSQFGVPSTNLSIVRQEPFSPITIIYEPEDKNTAILFSPAEYYTRS